MAGVAEEAGPLGTTRRPPLHQLLGRNPSSSSNNRNRNSSSSQVGDRGAENFVEKACPPIHIVLLRNQMVSPIN